MGDPKATLPEITAVVRERMSSGARGAARERLQAASEASRVDRENLVGKARALAAQTPIQPLALLHAVGEYCRRTPWWWRRRCRRRPASASSSAATIAELFRPARRRHRLGLPAAIGVKLALPDRPVVGLIGDGSAMYTCQTLWTAAHYHIGAVFVILNNKSYRILKQRLYAMRGHAEQADTYVAWSSSTRRSIRLALAFARRAAERAKTLHETTDLIAQGLKATARC